METFVGFAQSLQEGVVHLAHCCDLLQHLLHLKLVSIKPGFQPGIVTLFLFQLAVKIAAPCLCLFRFAFLCTEMVIHRFWLCNLQI